MTGMLVEFSREEESLLRTVAREQNIPVEDFVRLLSMQQLEKQAEVPVLTQSQDEMR